MALAALGPEAIGTRTEREERATLRVAKEIIKLANQMIEATQHDNPYLTFSIPEGLGDDILRDSILANLGMVIVNVADAYREAGWFIERAALVGTKVSLHLISNPEVEVEGVTIKGHMVHDAAGRILGNTRDTYKDLVRYDPHLSREYPHGGLLRWARLAKGEER